MATIVLHKPSQVKYLLLGTGYGVYRSRLPGVIGGSLFPQTDEGEIPVAAVCDRSGNMLWLLTEELLVLEVDGKPVEAWFGPDSSQVPESAEYGSVQLEYELCPGCGSRVASSAKECPSCGLALLVEETDTEDEMRRDGE
jgi:ribosomal protein S27AE